MSQNESKPDSDAKFENLAFEDAFTQLERIVRSLDAGQSNLEMSLADYEKGVKLLRHCHAILQNAERRIEILKGVSADGMPTTETTNENRFLTDAAQPGQRRGTSQADATGEDVSGAAKQIRKKRVRKVSQDNNFDEPNDIPFDFD